MKEVLTDMGVISVIIFRIWSSKNEPACHYKNMFGSDRETVSAPLRFISILDLKICISEMKKGDRLKYYEHEAVD